MRQDLFKEKRIITVSIVLLLFFINIVKGEAKMIQNPDSICIFNTAIFDIQAGYSLVSNSDYAVEYIVDNKAYIKFRRLGMVTVNLGSNTKDVWVYNPAPYILLGQNLFCGSLFPPSEGGRGGFVLEEDDECQKVCDSTCIWYFAGSKGEYKGKKFKWIVQGAYNIKSADTLIGDSIQVCWGGSDYGSITMIEESPDGCQEQVEGCVLIIGSPNAVDFGDPADMKKDTIYICQNQDVVFKDISKIRDEKIENWCWDFGDGDRECGNVKLEGLPLELITHNYSKIGTFRVRLSYTTECGCEKIKEKIVIVDSGKRMEIYCNNPACHNDIVEYHTDSICANYEWSVKNGTIIGPKNGSTVKIEWGDPEEGYGIITLRALAQCKVCNPVVSLKIDILPSKPKLIYPKMLCAGEPITHSGISMMATKYAWQGDIHIATRDYLHFVSGIVPSSSANKSSYLKGVYKMVLFDWYGDTLCQSSVPYSTTIQDTFHWIGPDTVCKNSTQQYRISLANANADWIEVIGGTPKTTQTFKDKNSVSISFPNYGIYTIKAKDSFLCDKGNCVKTVYVPAIKPIAKMEGDTEVCLQTNYHYKAVSKQAGFKLNWIVVGGSLVNSSIDKADIIFNTLGNKKIGVYSTMLFPPYCNSDTLWQTIYNPIRKNTILGLDAVCANGTNNYELEEKRGVEHEWSLVYSNKTSASDLGSITVLNPREVKVIWNNAVPQPVQLRVIYSLCGKKDTVYKTINITAPPTITIGGKDNICIGVEALYTCNVVGGATSYNWTSGTLSVASPTLQSTNISASTAGAHTIQVSVYSQVCNSLVTASRQINVLPKPNATISTVGNTFYCANASPNQVLVNVSIIGNGSYSFNPAQSFYTSTNNTRVTITDNLTGCTAITDPIVFTPIGCDGGGGGCNYQQPSPAINVTYTTNCGVVNYSVSGAITNITVNGKPGANGTITYNDAGLYNLKINANDANGCTLVSINPISVPVKANFLASFVCIDGIKKIVLRDISTIQSPSININSVSWTLTGPMGYSQSGSGSSYTTPNLTSLAPGTYNVSMTVNTSGGISSQSCSKTGTVVVAPDYKPTFTISKSSACSGNVLDLTLTSPTSIMNAEWFYGSSNVSWLGGKTAKREYVVKNPTTFLNYVRIMDNNGCKYTSDPISINVVPNNLVVSVTSLVNNVCISQSPIQLTADVRKGLPSYSYLWNRIVPSLSELFNADTTGRYFVKARDVNGCERESEDIPINYIPFPIIESVGKLNYCVGDKINVIFDAGSSRTNVVVYPSLGTVGMNRITGIATAPGVYTVYATATSAPGCTITIVREIVIKAKPTLTIAQNRLSCVPYQVELKGIGSPKPLSPVTGAYLWGHGSNLETIKVRQGGIYKLKYTNEDYCQVDDTSIVDKALKIPEGFPEGCLSKPCRTACYDSLNSKPYQIILNFDRAKYDSWEWEINGIAQYSGRNSQPTNPLLLPTNVLGTYKVQLKLTHNGCTVVSPMLTVPVEVCCNFDIVDNSLKLALCDKMDEITLNPTIKNINLVSGYKYEWFRNSKLISNKPFLKVTESDYYYLKVSLKNCKGEYKYNISNCTFLPKVALENLIDWNSNSNLKVVSPLSSGLEPWEWRKETQTNPIFIGNPFPVDHCLEGGKYEVQSSKCSSCPNSKVKIEFDPKVIKYNK